MSGIKEDFKKSDAKEVLHSPYEKTRTPYGGYLTVYNDCIFGTNTNCTNTQLSSPPRKSKSR